MEPSFILFNFSTFVFTDAGILNNYMLFGNNPETDLTLESFILIIRLLLLNSDNAIFALNTIGRDLA